MEHNTQGRQPSDPTPPAPNQGSNTAAPKAPAAETQPSLLGAGPLFPAIDLITRSTASIVLLIYGLGFVILGFHDAKYGVVQFSPFRARIVLVGFVFVMLVSLAAAAQHYGLAYFGPLEPV